MAAHYKTTMLRAGHTYHSGDRKVPVTKERLQHWQSEHNRLRKAGYAPPMHYDHSKELEMQVPITMDSLSKKSNRSAKNSIGFLDKFDLSDDGQSAELTYKVIDDKVAKQLDEGVVHLSPILLSKFQDGAKNNYRDVVGHLDVVNYPVDYSQSAAEKVAIAMGLEPVNDNSYVVSLKLDDHKSEPLYREDIATAMGIKTDDEPEVDDEENNESAVDDETSVSDGASNELTEDIGPLLRDLTTIGIVLPADTNLANFVERLRIAVPAFISASPLYQTEESIDGTGNTFGNDSGERIVAEHEMATTMSIDTFANDLYREKHQTQLDQMLAKGQVTPAEHKQHSENLGTIKLSLTDDGKPEGNSVTQFIASREAVPKGTFWSSKRKAAEAKPDAEDHPDPIEMAINPDYEDGEKLTGKRLDEVIKKIRNR